MKVEKNIPIKSRKTKNAIFIDLAAQMQVGDSVLVPTGKERQYLCNELNRSGYSMQSYRFDDGSYRVWKTIKK